MSKELLRSGVAMDLRQEAAAAEVLTGELVPGGDDVPGSPAAGEMIEGGELAGDLVGSLKVELIVPASPRRSVTAASAAKTVKVSGRPDDVEVVDLAALALEGSPRPGRRSRTWPARRFPRDARRSWNSMSLPERGSLHTVVLLTPGKWRRQVDLLLTISHGRLPPLVGTRPSPTRFSHSPDGAYRSAAGLASSLDDVFRGPVSA